MCIRGATRFPADIHNKKLQNNSFQPLTVVAKLFHLGRLRQSCLRLCVFIKFFVTFIRSAVVHVNGIFKFLSVCDERRGLTKDQVKTCYNFPEHMLYILDGSKLALNECKQQFAGRKWNCTFPHRNIKPFLHPPMPLGKYVF